MANWQVQEAKAHLSDVIKEAVLHGPQIITHHGAERAVVVAIEDYRALTARSADFIEHLLSAPDFGDFELERSKDTGRIFEFEE